MSKIRPPIIDVPSLSTEEIIYLIQNNEDYSSCCKVIEEKKLKGQDILNITENQIVAWRKPRWLIRKLLSLKMSLTMNPELLLESVEEDFEPMDSPKNGRKIIADRLNTLFKSPETQKKDISQHDGTYLQMTQRAVDAFYDDNNYLKFTPTKPQEKETQKKIPPKSNLPLKGSIQAKNQRFSRWTVAPRKPIAVPRSDYEDEKPFESTKFSPRPQEDDNDYELPPMLTSFSEDIYIDPDRKTDTDINISESKTLGKKPGYDDIIPPLPQKLPVIKKKHSAFEVIDSIEYVNVQQSQNPGKKDNSSPMPNRKNLIPKPTQKINSPRKKLPQNSPTSNKGWSTLTRPLPPIPKESLEKLSSQTKEKLKVEEVVEISLEKEDEQDDLPEYLNTIETTKSSNAIPKYPNILKKAVNTQSPAKSPVIQKPHLSQLLSQISEKKLNPVKPIRENFTNDSTTEDLKRKSEVKLNPVKPIRDSFLNDSKVAEEKKKILEERRHKREQNNQFKTEVTTPSKINLNLPLPPPVPQNFPTFIAEQEEEEEEAEEAIDLETDDFSESDAEELYDNLYNFNNEKYFRHTDRKGAKLLLHDLEDGAFVLRPSQKFFLSITVKKNNKYFNIGIKKNENQTIYCGEGFMKTPEFASIASFLEHFETTPFIFQGDKNVEEVYLKKLLPTNRF